MGGDCQRRGVWTVPGIGVKVRVRNGARLGRPGRIREHPKALEGVPRSERFRAAFSERSKTAHICRMAEGHFGGFFGWPNFTATLSGPFMSRPPTGKRSEFRVIDIYRREGSKLVENWVFIDLLHFWRAQGVDILADLNASDSGQVLPV